MVGISLLYSSYILGVPCLGVLIEVLFMSGSQTASATESTLVPLRPGPRFSRRRVGGHASKKTVYDEASCLEFRS